MSKTVITVSQSKLSDANAFIEEVKEVFNSAIPPVYFEISSREEVEAFANLFKSTEHGYFGKKISCKSANSFAPANYTAAEIYSLNADKYPIELSFKSIANLQDFAVGYMKAVDTLLAPVPVPETSVPQSSENPEKKESRKPTPDMYEVNPFAEKYLNFFLTIHLIIGWVLAIISVVSGIVLGTSSYSEFSLLFIFAGIIAGILILYSTYSLWAVNKVVINMSRNLFNINERLKNRANQ